MAITYDEKKYRDGIDTSYYDKAVKEFNDQAEKSRTTQLNSAAETRDSALRQAYIKRMQDQRALDQNLAVSGIRGGATETSNLRLATNYGNQRANANAAYSNSVNQINQNIDQQKFENKQTVDSQAEQYRQNLAQAKWQAAREDETNEAAKRDSDANYWKTYYTAYAKTLKKKKAKSMAKEIAAMLEDKTLSPDGRTKLEQQYQALNARAGGILLKI